MGSSFEDYAASEKEDIVEVKVSLTGEEEVFRPGSPGFEDLVREVLHVTYEIDAVEQAIVKPEKTHRMQNESDFVRATIRGGAALALPNDGTREKTSSLYVVFVSNVTTLAGKPLLCHQDLCTPYHTTYDLREGTGPCRGRGGGIEGPS